MAIVLFDIDRTLFDPKKFGSLYREGLMEALGVGEDSLATAIADYYSTLETSTDFDPDALITYLAGRFGKSEEAIADIFWKPEYFKKAAFEDAEPVLRSLSSENSLGVFSEGLRKYQEYKLEHTGLKKYFDPNLIFIYRRKVAEEAFASIPREAIVVEDRHDVAAALSKTTKTIWLNRLSSEKDPQIRTIHSLDQLSLI